MLFCKSAAAFSQAGGQRHQQPPLLPQRSPGKHSSNCGWAAQTVTYMMTCACTYILQLQLNPWALHDCSRLAADSKMLLLPPALLFMAALCRDELL
jgi:hypothetical protein